MASNGALPASALVAIPGGRLATNAGKSWLRLRAHIGKKHGVWIAPTSSRVAYRTLAEQQYFWNLYQSGKGALAARPGTSNHGWGLAVDVPTTRMAQLINQEGAPFGWQKRWSDAPSEWWHFKYAPQHDTKKGQAAKPKPSPVTYLTAGEMRSRNKLIRARRTKRKKGGWKNAPKALRNAAAAKKALRKHAKGIKTAATKKGGGGWSKHHRRERHTYINRLIAGKAKR